MLLFTYYLSPHLLIQKLITTIEVKISIDRINLYLLLQYYANNRLIFFIYNLQ